jgi:riboflavin biosynthesis pyrimidine reductase
VLAEPIEVLFEQPDLPGSGLPRALQRAYGADLGFRDPCVFANFVTSIDGVVALPVAAESGQIISQDSEADRFVMGLLRTCADAVLIGAGTFRKSPGSLWHAEAIFPKAAALFAEARRAMRKSPRPPLVLVTGSGAVDIGPALEDGIVVTTSAGAAALRSRVPGSTRVLAMESGAIRLAEVVSRLRAEGFARLLTEGGPSLFAEFVDDHLVDELFVTGSPALFGRFVGDGRKSLAAGRDLAGTALTLLSARRQRSHLFLRYELAARARAAAPSG